MTDPDALTAPNPFRREPPARGFSRWVPGIALMMSYQRPWLAKDFAAGLVLTAILIPTLKIESPALLFNRRHVDLLALKTQRIQE